MKGILQITFMAVTTLLVVYIAVNPQWGVVYSSPTAAIGVGAIGLGLIVEGRKRRAATAATQKQR